MVFCILLASSAWALRKIFSKVNDFLDQDRFGWTQREYWDRQLYAADEFGNEYENVVWRCEDHTAENST